MHPYTLPLIKSLFRGKNDHEIPMLQSKLDHYTAPEAKLESFRTLTHYPNNGYLPITWPHIGGWGLHMKHLTDPTFPLRLPGIVHVDNSIWQKRPLGSGEKLSIVCSLERCSDHENGITFVLVNKVSIAGELVWKSRSTMLYRDAPKQGRNFFSTHQSSDGIGSQNKIWKLPKGLALGYAMVSGDINPIHLSKLSARLFGFNGVIIHGMWILARVTSEHEELLKSDNIRIQCRFKKPIILPNQVVYRFWNAPNQNELLEFRVLDPKSQASYVTGTIGKSQFAPDHEIP